MSTQSHRSAPPRGEGELVGRQAEQDAIDALLLAARDGRGAALVLRGEPGIGKTALLRDAVGRARDTKVLRCAGTEAERDLPFAAIHQLVRSHAALIDRLPAPQAAGLRAALGLTYAEDAPDRFLVSVGLLGLLDAICDAEGPVLCCVDDAHWLDEDSAQALAFAARRVDAKPIALLIATRDDEHEHFAAPGVPGLGLRGLDDDHARALLAARLDRQPAPSVVGTLIDAARGNPLALLTLSSALTDAQVDGVEPILGPPPVNADIQAAFGARVAALPEATGHLLLLAAADDEGDLAAIARGAARLGLDLGALDAAERAGLVRVDASIGFRHPLLRSVVYRQATYAERRAAHATLAAVIDDRLRAAWHRALIAEAADDSIADELASHAELAASGGEHAAAAAAFERSAELSSDQAAGGHRLCRAAQAALAAGRLDAALALADRARPLGADPPQLARIGALERSRRGSIADAEMLARDAADVRWAAFVALQHDGHEHELEAIGPFDRDGVPGTVASLTVRAAAQVAVRQMSEAATTIAKALEVAEPLGFENDVAVLLAMRARVAAFHGHEAQCREDAEAAMRRGIANGLGWATRTARLALAELEHGLGNAAEAVEHLAQLRRGTAPAAAVADEVDAALRAGEPERAAAALEACCPASDDGALARAQAQLTADANAAERLFLAALDRHAGDASPFERARTQLAYGERLRRDRRKVEARTQLRAALDAFEGLGATWWAQRAAGELRATGETARKRDASTVDDLTPQELRIAALVATGASNRDVATQLFVSPKTVEYHLRKVFLKCGVASRVELARMSLQPLAA